MRKNILFDLDGTLTDSGEGIINCSLLTLEHYGIPLPSREEMRSFVGPPAPENFKRLGIPAEQIPEAIRYYRSHYMATGIYENEVYPGIPELLETLCNLGCRLYVATSKPEFMTHQILERFGLSRYFTLICGAASDTERNTKEAVIAHLLKESGGLDNPIMIGDTVYDVRGASLYGIPTIGVTWGYGMPEDLRKEGAVAIVENTQELLEILIH